MDVAATIAKMKLCGMSAEQIVTALECVVAGTQSKPIDEQAERRRAADRARKAASRSADIPRNSADKEIPPIPPKEITTPVKPTNTREARKHSLPDDFQPNAATLRLAEKLGFSDEDLRAEIEKMRDWANSKGEKCLDWNARLRIWLNRAANDRKPHYQPHNRRPSPAQQFEDAFSEIRAELAGTRKVVGL